MQKVPFHRRSRYKCVLMKISNGKGEGGEKKIIKKIKNGERHGTRGEVACSSWSLKLPTRGKLLLVVSWFR
jgi:hypothetical protein